MTALPDAATWRAWGIDPDWSRTLDVASHDGSTHRWHLLDTAPAADSTVATVVCVHGNPTWAYAWKSFMTTFGDDHRVIALDQLGMGYSERTDLRRYRTRVDDLADVIAALDIDRSKPLVLAAHDWGGAIAMGWAVDHPDELAGLVLCNTGIGVPAGRSAPRLISLAASKPLRDLVCRRTSTFVEGTVRLSGRRISKVDRQAFRAPYRNAADRRAIADFVGDVPLTSPHPSEADLLDVADRLHTVEAPVLLAWGSADPVFDDDFAADLAGRFPNSSLQRYPDANHLVMAEADVASTVDAWLADLVDPSNHAVAASDTAGAIEHDLDAEVIWAAIERRRHDDAVAVHDDATGESISFRELAVLVDNIAADLRTRGLEPGDRVAMLTPPGVGLIAAVYGVWRAGGVTVVADRGLGLGGLGAAVRQTRPSWVIGPRPARVAARTLRWAPRATMIDVDDLVAAPAATGELDVPAPDELAAVLFTSGATGPAKGVRYTHRQFAAQRDALARTYGITEGDRLVAAFAPFALYGPALGITSVLADCDVTKPGELTADAVERACAAVEATMVFASPAALTNVLRTAGRAQHPALARVRLVQSAGAPVPAETLRAVAALTPKATLHTPYGMTEALPVADIDLAAIEHAEHDRPTAGVCVGHPVEGAEVMIAALGFDATAGVPDPLPTGRMGEVLVRAPWVSDGYLGLWGTQRQARPGSGWHRSGDVGHLDGDGRLWIEGRSVHVIDAVDGPITSVPVERSVERAGIDGVTAGRVAAIGVGPAGVQQLVVVIESPDQSVGLAPAGTVAAVRDIVDHPVAAVLITDGLPVDIRHNAKIDRTAVATWAGGVLDGSATPRRRFRR
ncbi:alpha/beta fold hydrolase [Ilumatobacter coccineus]|uniref:Putative fatty-acid--CoA ligase n=1 Tax=Ilumatobacter coccineus (strain NBRC 103263 / KCTC 29153 / YM16-304) TaxID=1313172 RepID=A0A6C7E9K7_ILUCY|nr:alpha/beta fold hydrolase [Ilumatobacter coccineus]BAN02702.1 putative fatty-acid--CoA ligase [Ilumatobacter coccineus YM16-304]